MTPLRAFIVDVDNTVIDAERIKSVWKNRFGTKFPGAYKKSKDINGLLDIKKLAKNLNVSPEYFINTKFKNFLLKNALLKLSELKSAGKIIILSLGDANYQSIKIKKSGIERVAGKDNVLITQNKKRGITKIINTLREQNFEDISMIDDYSTNLETAYNACPKIINVWVRFGKHKNREPMIKDRICREVDSFEDATFYLTRLIGVIHPPKKTIKLSILKGITREEMRQVVRITKSDKRIRKYTHDSGRFKNLKSMQTWQNRGKTIYTLTNRKGKVKGIIWIGKKSFLKYSHTIAIRTYKPIRGTGTAKIFLKAAVNDFFKTNKGALWLSVMEKNSAALGLYEKFGFERVSKDNKGRVIMGLSPKTNY